MRRDAFLYKNEEDPMVTGRTGLKANKSKAGLIDHNLRQEQTMSTSDIRKSYCDAPAKENYTQRQEDNNKLSLKDSKATYRSTVTYAVNNHSDISNSDAPTKGNYAQRQEENIRISLEESITTNRSAVAFLVNNYHSDSMYDASAKDFSDSNGKFPVTNHVLTLDFVMASGEWLFSTNQKVTHVFSIVDQDFGRVTNDSLDVGVSIVVHDVFFCY